MCCQRPCIQMGLLKSPLASLTNKMIRVLRENKVGIIRVFNRNLYTWWCYLSSSLLFKAIPRNDKHYPAKYWKKVDPFITAPRTFLKDDKNATEVATEISLLCDGIGPPLCSPLGTEKENYGFHLHPRRAALPQNRLVQGENGLLRIGQVNSTAL